MTSFTTFYLSRIIGKKVFNLKGNVIGTIKDILVDSTPSFSDKTTHRPLVLGISLRIGKETRYLSFNHISITKINHKIKVICKQIEDMQEDTLEDSIMLSEVILYKQIVDLNGRKVVRVNDVRMVTVSDGTYAVAVDVGIEGLLRRFGLAKPLKSLLATFKLNIPSKFILWDDMEAIDYTNLNIKLSTSYSKLNTLHPSDLADIIEELDHNARTTIFSALDEEKAADVLEELEPHAQKTLIENMPVNKIADVLEKMPANEAADIIDTLEDDKAELLLKEMEDESSQEVRELLEYNDNEVGSIMTTEFLSFNENYTAEEVIKELRAERPEADALYSLFVIDDNKELIASFSLRDLLISSPNTKISEIMHTEPIFLHDNQKIDDIAELISRYNLLAIPVIDENDQLVGMVVIDDIIEDLMNERRTNKK